MTDDDAINEQEIQPAEELYCLTRSDPPLPSSFLTAPTTNTPPNQPVPPPFDPEQFHLSMHALTGESCPRTLRFTTSIQGHDVSVLVDNGSSHNIMQPRIASFLALPTQPIHSFSVMVGNGAYLQCSGLCPEVPLLVKNQCFQVPFYLLPIQGADVVLGVQWLKTIGPFIADYTVPFMQFYHQGSLVTLHGSSTPDLIHASFHQITRMLHTNSIDTCHTITMLPIQQPTSPNSSPIEPNSLSQDDITLLNSYPQDLAYILTHIHTFSQPHMDFPPTDPMTTTFTLSLIPNL